MAIKVIKHGETKFKVVCPVCGCEFEYEYEDLTNAYSIVKQVKCPDCGEWITHKQIFPTYPTYPNKPAIEPYDPITKPYVTWDSTGIGAWPDCETCPNKPAPGKTIIGDTPCSLCIKNKPYCSGNVNGAVDWKVDCTRDPGEFKSTVTTKDFDTATSSYAADGNTNEEE